MKLHRLHSNANLSRRRVHTTAFAVLPLLVAMSFAYGQTQTIQDRLENAASLLQANRIPEAERQLNSILILTPNNQDALNLLGTIRAQQGRLDDAEALLIRAVKVDPSFVPVHMN